VDAQHARTHKEHVSSGLQIHHIIKSSPWNVLKTADIAPRQGFGSMTSGRLIFSMSTVCSRMGLMRVETPLGGIVGKIRLFQRHFGSEQSFLKAREAASKLSRKELVCWPEFEVDFVRNSFVRGSLTLRCGEVQCVALVGLRYLVRAFVRGIIAILDQGASGYPQHATSTATVCHCRL